MEFSLLFIPVFDLVRSGIDYRRPFQDDLLPVKFGLNDRGSQFDFRNLGFLVLFTANEKR